MDIGSHFGQAVGNLLSSKLRSILAVIGIVVGTGSVVALIMSSQMATEHALQQFKSLGTNLIMMDIQNQETASKTQDKSFTMSMVPALKRSSHQIKLIAPYTNNYAQYYIGGMSSSASVVGVGSDFNQLLRLHLKTGRFISYLDKKQLYCVIGSDLAKKIRARVGNPIGKQILLGKFMFTIVGVLQPWPTNYLIFIDVNGGVFIPVSSSYYLSKQTSITSVVFRLGQKPNLPIAQQKISQEFNRLVQHKKLYFRNPQQIINIVGKQRQTFNVLLIAIGSISLIVGGIGVMNIMLVSVVERRREIGIRMAIGAQRIDILLMFLIESVMLTIFGGIVGIALGIGVSMTLAKVMQWGVVFYWLPPVLGFAVSVLVGVFSGFYPALNASRLDPIKTLQSE